MKTFSKIFKIIVKVFATLVLFKSLDEVYPDNWMDIEECIQTKSEYAEFKNLLNGHDDVDKKLFAVNVFDVVRRLYKMLFTWAIWF